jgi:phage tail sheath protein FI
MPVTPTYPGVYIEELPSGVRTITGVATSITAFLGRAAQGPVDEQTVLTGPSDFERNFGAPSPDYPAGYAVQDFFLNGGSEAVFVRLFKPGDVAGRLGRTATKQDGGVLLQASSPGKWGNNLLYHVGNDGITDDVARRFGLQSATDLFNLRVYQAPQPGQTRPQLLEVHRNLAVKQGQRFVEHVLQENSLYMRATVTPGGDPPAASPFDPNNPPTPSPLDPNGADSDLLTDPADFEGQLDTKTGMFAVEKTPLFNLLCIPPDQVDVDVPTDVLQKAVAYCAQRRAMLIVDPPADWSTDAGLQALKSGPGDKLRQLGLQVIEARNAALYYPRVKRPDPANAATDLTTVACGAIAGIMARTDTTRGVWKAPAGVDATFNGISGLAQNLTDPENGLMNPVGINCLRAFRVAGNVVWGARTLRGDDQLADEYKYVPVRRLALFLEESLYRGTQWAVFEPNDEPLWAQLRLNIGAFMQDLFRKGAFQGRTPKEAYFVKCDKETTTQTDINLGRVNVVVGFAPLKPAEFVILQFQQMAGQIPT